VVCRHTNCKAGAAWQFTSPDSKNVRTGTMPGWVLSHSAGLQLQLPCCRSGCWPAHTYSVQVLESVQCAHPLGQLQVGVRRADARAVVCGESWLVNRSNWPWAPWLCSTKRQHLTGTHSCIPFLHERGEGGGRLTARTSHPSQRTQSSTCTMGAGAAADVRMEQSQLRRECRHASHKLGSSLAGRKAWSEGKPAPLM